MTPDLESPTRAEVDAIVSDFARDERAMRDAVSAKLVGQEEALEQIMTVLLAGGNALIEGVPGTGKTMLVHAIATTARLEFRRVQFTPDLVPADILGCDTLLLGEGGKAGEERIEFRPGPIFTQFLLADEINRGTPRTQSALLEAMQERGVTVGGHRYPLDALFTVFATRNPIELEGTYPLPEAQLDRFLLEVHLSNAGVDDMVDIAERTTREEEPTVSSVVTPERLKEMRHAVRQVVAAPPVIRYAARLVHATQPDGDSPTPLVEESVRYGAGVRALQALVLAGKVEALRQGRSHLAHDDVQKFLLPALRHRIILSLEGEARGVDVPELTAEIVRATKTEE